MPSVEAFRSVASTSSVFQAALSVWHLHDWVWHERNPGRDSRGSAFNVYRSELLAACPELGWLRDVADAGKRRGSGRLPEVQGAQPQMRGGSGLMLVGVGGGATCVFFLVLNDGSKQNVDAVLRAAIEFWCTDLKAKNLPSPLA